jgi:hypothetical protein
MPALAIAAAERRGRDARSDMVDGALPALAAVTNATPRAVIATDASPAPVRAVPPVLEAARDLAVTTDRLGDVRIAVEGSAHDLKVALGLAPSTLLAAADVERLAQGLAADLAAAGVRLQSLQVSGGGVAAGGGFGSESLGGDAGGGSAPGQRDAPPGYRPPPAAAPGPPRPPRSDRYA